jgi:hypothetical protein
MIKIDEKQIKLLNEVYKFVDEEPDAISGVPPYAGLLAFYSEYSALSIPHLVEANLLKYDRDVTEILSTCWNEICERLKVDSKYRFKNIKEFINKCEDFF